MNIPFPKALHVNSLSKSPRRLAIYPQSLTTKHYGEAVIRPLISSNVALGITFLATNSPRNR